jgi:hypothetical protein
MVDSVDVVGVDVVGAVFSALTIGCLVVCRYLARGQRLTTEHGLTQVTRWTAITTALAAVAATSAVITDGDILALVFIFVAVLNAFLLGRMVQRRATPAPPTADDAASITAAPSP